MNAKIKKYVVPNLPYLFIFWFFCKVGTAYRLAAGADFGAKLIGMMKTIGPAFGTIAPGLAGFDLLVGLVGAVALRLVVYNKVKNAKKFRKDMEYGSARWGTAKDIAPFIDPKFENNVILTGTEFLTMNTRPKIPANARNLNCCIIGSSGSGKTRFWLTPQLLQAHSSYVCVDPKGGVLSQVGHFLQKRKGYKIKVFNSVDFRKSMHYNPMAYIKTESDVLKFVNALITNTKGQGKEGDEFWTKAETLLYCAATDWNEQTKAEEWRGAWADICNRALEQSGHAERVDHRSYERQGIDQIPTVHLGVAAFQMERRGIRTERGNINRDIEISNQKLRQLKARISKLQNWLKEEAANTEPPTLADVITGILSRREQSGKSGRYQAIGNLKAAANMLNFLTANNIKDMAGLEEKVQTMYGKQLDIRDKLKPMERRLKVLDEHIRQADNYLQFREVYKKYKQQKPKKQEAFAEAHRREITLYEAAERYLGGVMNGKTTLPTKTWRAERDKLNADRQRLNGEYLSLKNDIAEVEKIRRNVYDIMSMENRREQPTRQRGIEL